ncbi:MAG: hypothetical protein IJ350_05965 [Clostridia bacterium]|nr:hypothetical protein [Clostridia bacterium]
MPKEKLTKVCHYLCAIVLAVILVCQFTPFWTYATDDGEATASISSYIWFPTENKAADAYIAGSVGDSYDINQLVLPAVLVLVLGAAGLVMCLFKSGETWTGLLPLGCGLAGLWGFLFKAGFKLGTAWGIHVILYAAALILGVLALYFALKKEKAA